MGRLRGLFLTTMTILLSGLLVMGAAEAALAAAVRSVVTGVRVADHDGVTRFVIDLSDPVEYRVTTDSGQIVVELPQLEWQSDQRSLWRPVGVIKNFSYGSPHAGAGRIVLQTVGKAELRKSFIIPPSEGANARLVIDLIPAPPSALPHVAAAPPPSKPTPAPVAAPAPAPKPLATVAPPPAPPPSSPPPAKPLGIAEGGSPFKPVAVIASPAESQSLHSGGTPVAVGMLPAPLPRPPLVAPEPATAPPPEPVPAALVMPGNPAPPPPAEHVHQPHAGKPIVVIDPGHGGPDPGATSVSGAYEKNIVLALAREVKVQLDKGNKVKCLLTRDHDVFIPLRERVAIARADNADLFMSLHADTVDNDGIRGLSVYTLSQNSSDAEAQALADKENKSDIVAGIDLSNESPEVTNILIDLVQRESMNLSAGFAAQIIQEVQRETHNVLEANTHRFAGFAVLKAPDIPSVLVETGYLSNEQDEQMLRKPEYRTKLATALARAIERYFAQTQRAKRS